MRRLGALAAHAPEIGAPRGAFSLGLWRALVSVRSFSMFCPTEHQKRVRDDVVACLAGYYETGWKELCESGDPDAEVEIEARVGKRDPATNNYLPGVSQQYFDGLWNRLQRSPEVGEKSMKATERVDVTFEGRVRVTVDGWRTSSPSIAHVTTKIAKQEWKNTFSPLGKGLRLCDHEIRVSFAREIEMSKGDKRSAYETAALSACGFSPAAADLALGKSTGAKRGSKFRLVTAARFPDAEAVSYASSSNDALFAEADANEGFLVTSHHHLSWTLLRPKKVERLKGRGEVDMADEASESRVNQKKRNVLLMTNMAGVVQMGESSPMIPCAHGQYVVECEPGDVESTASKRSAAELDLNPRLFRRKKRFSFALNNNSSSSDGDLRIDLTQTQSSDDFEDLLRSERLFEIEVEKAFIPGSSEPPSTADLLAFSSALFRYVFCAPRQFGGDIQPQARAQIAAAFANLPSLDDQKVAADHYSSLKRDASTRSESLIYHMRCLNNWIKSVLIGNYIFRLRNESGGNAISILDLACGKGADIMKFVRASDHAGTRVGYYLGLDIARGSLDDAVKRHASFKSRRDGKLDFPAGFVCADLGSRSIYDGSDGVELEMWTEQKGWKKQVLPLGSSGAQFDFVSMQFAIHYMFETEKRAHTFFRDVSASMRDGAYFVTTTVHANTLVQHLLLQGASIHDALESKKPVKASLFDDVSREVCTIRFDPATVEKITSGKVDASGAGLRYWFELRDDARPTSRDGAASKADGASAAVCAPEWIVPQHVIASIAAQHDLEMVEYTSLPNFFRANAADPAYNELLYKMRVCNRQGTFTRIEWDIMSLYCVVVFRKKVPRKVVSFMETYKYLKETMPSFSDLSSAEKKDLVKKTMAKNSDVGSKRKRADA